MPTAEQYATDQAKLLHWGSSGTCDGCGNERKSLATVDIGTWDEPEPFAICFPCFKSDARAAYRAERGQ